MHWLDGVVVGIYLAATLAIGIRLARRVDSSQDFFLAGRKLSFWAIGMSLVVSDIGALEMIGGTAGAFTYGIAQANYEWIGCVPAMIIGGLVFMPVYWRSGIYSIPEYLGCRYGSPVRAIQALLWTIFLGAAIGVFFSATAEMFAGTFGWPKPLSIGLTAVVVAVYTIGGGLEAVVLTDVIQCVALFVGGLALAGFGVQRVGGIGALRSAIARHQPATKHHLQLLMPVGLRGNDGMPTGYPWPGIVLGLGLVLSPAYWIGNQAIVQRTLGARDVWSARSAMVFGAALKTIVPLAFVLPGLLAIPLLEGRTGISANGIYPLLIKELMPVGLRGVLYAAFLAALMSSVDSYTNSAATILLRDVYQRFIAPTRDDAHYLRAGRYFSLGIILLGVLLVPIVARYRTIYDAFQSYLSFFQGPTLALLLAGLLWRGATPRGGLVGLIVGVAGALVMHLAGGMHFLYLAWWSFLLALGAVYLASLGSTPLPPEELDRLVVVGSATPPEASP